MSLLLRQTPGEWDGTFRLLVETLAEDLLLDGDIAVTINNEVRPRMLTAYDPQADCLVFAPGNDTVGVEEISEIEVP